MVSYIPWRDGREAEGSGLLNRHTIVKTVSRVRIPLSPPDDFAIIRKDGRAV